MKEQLNVKDFSRMQKRRKAMELDVMIHWDFEHDNGEDPRARELAMTMPCGRTARACFCTAGPGRAKVIWPPKL